MSATTAADQVAQVDAVARSLYQRAKQISSSEVFVDVAAVLRQLHISLRHLRTEAADPDSLLNATDTSVYARQLRPIIEDCDFALKQLETIFNKYGDAPRSSDDGLEDRVAVIRTKLVNERTNVDLFLDTVQLHNPASQPAAVPTDSSPSSLEDIKDKVDAVARRVFTETGTHADDGLWQEFKSELEKEGFSPQVLRKHKDVLRAYIRELESMSNMNGGTTPTVRGLLDIEARQPTSPKEMFSGLDNEKCLATMKDERRLPTHAPQHDYQGYNQDYYQQHDEEAQPRYMTQQPSFEQHSTSSDDNSSQGSDSLALVSTRDLMAMDHITTGVNALSLQAPPPNYSLSTSPSGPNHLMPAPYDGPASFNEPDPTDLSASQLVGSLPRSIPHSASHLPGGGPPPVYGTSPSMAARLAPDTQGNEIPLDAPWTKIKRSIISSEVLERAGVRYEARPEYVAILGRLSREQIADFARQSADIRAARERRQAHYRDYEIKYRHERSDSKSSREDDNEDDSILWDSSDSTDVNDDKTSDKGTKSYPYIVSPPEKKSPISSPSSTVQPKPILKKTENHVRFDPAPHDLEAKSPRSMKDRDDWERHRESHRRSRDHRDRERSDRPRDRERDRESSNRSRDHDRRSTERDRHASDRHGDYHRRDHRDRKGDRKEDRHSKKKAWGETLGAVGIGGAAVSLISVLAEAASAI
jgi:hypothetical protein